MSPSFPGNNFPNSGFANREHFGQVSVAKMASGILVSYGYHLLVCKFYISALLPFWVGVVATLNYGVMHIVKLCSHSEVPRIAATWSTYAGMKNPKTWRSVLSMCRNPGYFVCVKSVMLASDSERYLSSTEFVHAQFPKPAVVNPRDGNMGPKSELELGGEYLLQCFRGYNLCSHSVSLLIVCHALGCFIQREGISIMGYA